MIKHIIMTKNGLESKELTPVKAIRHKCMECSNWQYIEVKTCQMDDCPLFPYRLGKNPSIKMTEKQKEIATKNFVKGKK